MPVDERAGRIYSRREILKMVFFGSPVLLAGCLPGGEVPVTTPTVDIPTPAEVPTSTSVVVVERTATVVGIPVETVPPAAPSEVRPDRVLGQRLVVRNPGANLMTEPSIKARRIAALPAGSVVRVAEPDSINEDTSLVWRFVLASGIEDDGYVIATLLSANVQGIPTPQIPAPIQAPRR